MDYQDGTGQHIWLRYATEYKKDGRTHTIEVGIPVPLGASAETREKLLREAEIGMSQLVQHVEERVFQALERTQSTDTTDTQGTTVPMPLILPSSPVPKVVSTVSSSSATQSAPSVPDQPLSVQVRSAAKSTSVSAPQISPTQIPNVPRTPPQMSPTQVPNVPRTPPRTAPSATQAVDVPPTRDSVGASMPSSLGPTTPGGNLTIRDFVNYINKNLSLNPKQAMDLLHVKTLDGINLREALEKLKQIVAQQNAQSGPSAPQQSQQQASKIHEVRPVVSTPVAHNTLSSLPAQSTVPMRKDTAIDEIPTRPADEALEDSEQEHTLSVIELRVPQPAQPTRGFDEEDDLEDLEEPDNFNPSSKFSPDRIARARDKIIALRAIQGATTADPVRLRALRNVTDAEVSDEQILELVKGIWSVSTLKKLKVDQVGALISWANQDYFLDEVEVVLAVLEEEHYARGHR